MSSIDSEKSHVMSVSKAQDFSRIQKDKSVTYVETAAISYADYMYNAKNLLGKVLTVVDAVLGPVDDFEKNKATKDLIRGYFRSQADRMYNVAGVDSDQVLDTALSF